MLTFCGERYRIADGHFRRSFLKVGAHSLGGLALAVLLLSLHIPAQSADDKGGIIHLFNGRDLTNFYTWLGVPKKGEQPYGKNNDPEKVFTVHDGMIHISGKVVGGLVTEKEYENYHLVTEFKWGEKTWSGRKDQAMDSGIHLHCTGEDGAAGGTSRDLMEAIQCNVIEGGTGDFILVKGKNTPSLTVEAEQRGGQWYYKPGAPARTFTGSYAQIKWYGRDPDWKDVKGFRGKQDFEKPSGEWNILECICDGDKITIILNGKVVNAGTKASITKGKILFQSEWAELFFRKIDVKSLKR
jgi:hypothetical protein